jgi:hypothetical protein
MEAIITASSPKILAFIIAPKNKPQAAIMVCKKSVGKMSEPRVDNTAEWMQTRYWLDIDLKE